MTLSGDSEKNRTVLLDWPRLKIDELVALFTDRSAVAALLVHNSGTDE